MEKKTTVKRKNVRYNKKDKSAMLHLLSPLESAVFYGTSDPFTYNFEGSKVYVSRWMAMQLLNMIKRKMELLKAAHEREMRLTTVPFKYREALDDPKIILSLTPILRNRLCKIGCYTLYSIILKGRKFFEGEMNFNKNYMRTLDELLAKHKCRDLF